MSELSNMDETGKLVYVSEGEGKIVNKLFIGGLSWHTTQETLRNHFEQYGELLDVATMVEKSTGQPRGFGFVTFKEYSDMEVAVAASHTIDGRTVDVKRAVPRERQLLDQARMESKKLFVGGLGIDVTDEKMFNYFSKFGVVRDCVVMMDKKSNKSRGFGFVTFDTEESAKNCVNASNTICGRWVEVKYAEPHQSSSYQGKNYYGYNHRRNGGHSNGQDGMFGVAPMQFPPPVPFPMWGPGFMGWNNGRGGPIMPPVMVPPMPYPMFHFDEKMVDGGATDKDFQGLPTDMPPLMNEFGNAFAPFPGMNNGFVGDAGEMDMLLAQNFPVLPLNPNGIPDMLPAMDPAMNFYDISMTIPPFNVGNDAMPFYYDEDKEFNNIPVLFPPDPSAPTPTMWQS